jgi:hypothetical protein
VVVCCDATSSFCFFGRTSGTDIQGKYTSLSLSWDCSVGFTVVTEFRAYTTLPGIRFTQHYTAGVVNASAVANLTTTATSTPFVSFPAFALNGTEPELNALAFGGCQIQDSGVTKWSTFHGGGGQQSMPIVLHNADLMSMAFGYVHSLLLTPPPHHLHKPPAHCPLFRTQDPYHPITIVVWKRRLLRTCDTSMTNLADIDLNAHLGTAPSTTSSWQCTTRIRSPEC